MNFPWTQIRRRDFLLGASACLAFPQLRPHYRDQTPQDALLLKTNAALDDFGTEKEHDTIAAILSHWGASLRQAPRSFQSVEKTLAPGFRGFSPRRSKSKIVRPGAALEVRRITFAPEASLGPRVFLAELRASLAGLPQILTAEFQVTAIDVLPTGLHTLVRYEIVGAGPGFHREQRIGHWSLQWEAGRLQRWLATEETRSRSTRTFYQDVTQNALGSNPSYTAQLLHGVDHWRTVLDGASLIDIYGHNGISAGDIDGDGFDDLYVCQPAGLPNRLYRNRGDGTFEDITSTSGVGILENTACAIFADFDNDGRQDLVVVRANGPLLFLNQGGGKFVAKPNAFQFANPPQGTFTGAAVADYDRDGWLDIYFCLYVYYQGADQYKYPSPYFDAENGPPNFLMRNNGDGTFRDATAEAGLNHNNTRYSFCCGWGDFNNDGWPDLYVVNDFGRKNLYRNNGDGTFTDVAPAAGVEDVGAGMSVCWLEDGLYVANMWTAAGVRISAQPAFKPNAPEPVRALYRKHAMGNSLFHNNADGTFQNTTASAQVGMGRWSWSSDAFDFDHDGFQDIYIANGMISGELRDDLNSFFWRQVVANSPDVAKPSHAYEQGWNAVNELIRADRTWSGYERNVFYANNGDGTFSDVSAVVGLDFLEDGRSFALADFDHDGRLEVFLKNRNAPQLRVLKNILEGLPPSIAFRLRGVKSNRDAIGAAVTIETEAGRQTRMLQAGSGFLSQHSKEVFFGLGRAMGPVKATVRWPSGLVQQLHALQINHRVWVEEGVEPSRIEPFRARANVAAISTQAAILLPRVSETWLLAPVAAPDFSGTLAALRGNPVLLSFCATPPGLERLPLRTVTVDAASRDVCAIYNILFRYLFDRHRDLVLPTSFLIDRAGDVVKVYQGPANARMIERDLATIPQTTAQRLALALPFADGNAATYEYGRNHLSFGSVFFQRGYFDQAGTFFALALRADPSSAEAHYGMGSVYLKQQELVAARDSFEQAAKLTSSYPDTRPNACNNLGLLAAREGRTAEAIDHFAEALKLNPNHAVALENLGNAYRQQQRWPEARQALEHSLAIQPDDPETNYSLAMVFAQTGDTDRAYEYLQRALRFRPAYPEALNNLGVLYLRSRRRDEAVAAFEQCIRLAPAFDQAYLNLAQVFSLEGTSDKARAVLAALLKQHPQHRQAQRALEQLK